MASGGLPPIYCYLCGAAMDGEPYRALCAPCEGRDIALNYGQIRSGVLRNRPFIEALAKRQAAERETMGNLRFAMDGSMVEDNARTRRIDSFHVGADLSHAEAARRDEDNLWRTA